MAAIDLSSFFQTKAQASDFASRIATISEKIYETNFNLEKALLDEFGLKKKDIFMTLLRENKIAADSNSALKTFLTQVQEQITKLPILSLTVAIEPKEQTMKALSEWFVMNINQQVVFEITVDPLLIAGASISFNGKDTDLSIRSAFEKIVEENLEKTFKKSSPAPEAAGAAK